MAAPWNWRPEGELLEIGHLPYRWGDLLPRLLREVQRDELSGRLLGELGGLLGATAVAIKHEVVLAVIGGLFVMEAASVVVQVVSFKLTGKRVFLMAPIHHHYEKKGWAEPKIIVRFWIISILLALVALASMKLR